MTNHSDVSTILFECVADTSRVMASLANAMQQAAQLMRTEARQLMPHSTATIQRVHSDQFFRVNPDRFRRMRRSPYGEWTVQPIPGRYRPPGPFDLSPDESKVLFDDDTAAAVDDFDALMADITDTRKTLRPRREP